MTCDPNDLAGVHEIAERLKVTDTAIWQWRNQEKYDFPKPVVLLKCGPIFSMKAVVAWRERLKKGSKLVRQRAKA